MLELLQSQIAEFAPWLIVASIPLFIFAVVPAGRAQVDPDAQARTRVQGPQRYLAPSVLVEALERNLSLAGLVGVWEVRRLVMIKNIAGAVGLLLAVAIAAPDHQPIKIMLAIVFAIGPYFLPDLIVLSRAQQRQSTIQTELPDTLDQITISIEAGLGLETAIARAGQYGGGPLSEELVRTIQDMRVGLSRREAYLALAERTTVLDLKRFARAIMQADAYGVPVGNVVRTQAKELRAKRKQRAEERAMKIPVKVLFPLMFCILPVLFIIVLAPPILRLVATFQ